MATKEVLNQPAHFQSNVGATGLDLTTMPIKLQQTLTFELADDFNNGVRDPRWLVETPASYPTESGGFFQFAYPDSVPVNHEAIFNSPRGSIELETRFICETISSTMYPYSDYFVPFGPAILGGNILPPHLADADRESRLIWECWTNWCPYSNYLNFLPFCYGANGTRYWWSQANNQWQQDPGPNMRQGIFLYNPANIPITLKCEVSGQGLIIKAYKNDNPAQLIFQTGTSPARRLSDSYHLQLAHAADLDGGRTKYDYFKLSGAIIEAETGEVTLRRSYATKTKVTQYRMDRVLPTAGSKINIKVRSGDTLEALQAAAFIDVPAGIAYGNIETGNVNIPPGLFFDIKLQFVKASPGPQLNSFDFVVSPVFVEDDQPMILSIDGAGPGLAMVTSSEEGLVETANTKRLMDGDVDSQWVSLNASDTTPVTLQVSFLTPQGGGGILTYNAIILRNTNIKTLRVHAGITTLFEGEIIGDDVIIPFNTVTMPVVQIEVRTTKVANQNKKIGELYCGQVLVVLPNLDTYTPQRELFESGNLRTLGGKLVAYRGKNKYTARWTTKLTDPATKDAVEKAFKQNPLVTFWPEPGSKPRELYDVGWKAETFPYAYSDVYKAAGYTIEAEVTEI